MRAAFLPGVLAAGILAVTGPALAQHGPAGPDFAAASAEAGRLQPARGLTVQVWAAEPQLENPVAFAFDERGRCFVAETRRYGISVFDITQNTRWLTHDLSFRSVADRTAFLEAEFATNRALLTKDSELVRRVEDHAGAGRADTSEVLADGFRSAADGTAAGVAAQGGRVWFGNIPNLWRLAAEPGPNTPGSGGRDLLASGFGVHIGVTGHDLHGLTFGPDGRLYLSFGDRGLSLTNREGRVIDLPDTGGVLRCEPDGRNLEVFCTGLRNPQDLEFDDLGNLWTVDNDTAGDDPCRVLYLVEGGDYGWRCSYQHMAGFGPWVQEELWRGGLDGILPLAGTVSQGPAGLAYYPGTGFGDRLQGRFLHCDFPGGVVSFSVTPDGAGYRAGGKERFLWNLWPTDVKFAPDGAAYVLDWVQGWQMPHKGRIYRITDPAAFDTSEARDTRQRLAQDRTAASTEDLTAVLAHPDRRVRLAAAAEFVRRGADAWSPLAAVVRQGPATVARLHAAWALARITRAQPTPEHAAGLGRLALDLAADPDAEVRAQVALLAAAFPTIDAASAARRLLGQPEPRVRLFALEALATLVEHAPADLALPALPSAAELAKALGDGSDSYLTEGGRRLAGALHRRQGASPGDAFGGAWKSWAGAGSAPVRRTALLALRREASPEILAFLDDRDSGLALEAERAVYDTPIPAGYAAIAALVNAPGASASLLARRVRAAERLGGPDHAAALVKLAGDPAAPERGRAEALAALADWPAPNPIDAIVGLWRPMTGKAPSLPADLGRSAAYDAGVSVRRSPEAPRRALAALDRGLFSDPVLGPAAAAAAAALKAEELAPAILEALAAANDAPAARLLESLCTLQPRLGAAVVREAATNAGRPKLRTVALGRLDTLDAPAAATLAVGLVRAYLASPTPADLPASQAALRILAATSEPSGVEALDAFWRRAEAQAWPAALALDLDDAARRRPEPVWHTRSASRTNAWASGADPLAPWRPTLSGGDATRGRAAFFENPTLQCSRCHQVGGQGGTVGPHLDGVGGRNPPEYLLESIVFPNARIAPGFENASLQLRDGRLLAGVIKSETATALTLETTDEEGAAHTATYPLTDIGERRRGPSAMPEGLAAQMSLFDLRDLIAFLTSLR